MNATEERHRIPLKSKPLIVALTVLVCFGFAGFFLYILSGHPERAWQSYLINFLLWSSIAQGGLLFSVVMHITKARWSYPLNVLSESFAAFFPISLVLFLLLSMGSDYVFPPQFQNFKGSGGWFNLPFLFSRDFAALLVLYGLGCAYLYYALRLRKEQIQPRGRIGAMLWDRWSRSVRDQQWCRDRMSLFGVLYIIAYALVLTLLSIDLIMGLEPHWVSGLFGPYYFVKAFYIGLGALIILASIRRIILGEDSGLSEAQFHDMGKLFFAFCLLWADFFYCQLVVIWYGNISEETAYVIQRVMILPWKDLAWAVFGLAFLVPFVILMNRKIKTKPVAMIIVCSVVLLGIWLENLLLVGPALNPDATSLPLEFRDGLISLGFLGLMVVALTGFLHFFPQTAAADTTRVDG